MPSEPVSEDSVELCGNLAAAPFASQKTQNNH